MQFFSMLSSSQPSQHTPSESKTEADPSFGGGNSSGSEKHIINGSNLHTDIEGKCNDSDDVSSISSCSGSGSSTSTVSTLTSAGERTNNEDKNDEEQPSSSWMCFSMPCVEDDEVSAPKRENNDVAQHEIEKNGEKHNSTTPNVDNEEVEAEVESTVKEQPTEMTSQEKEKREDDYKSSAPPGLDDEAKSFMTMASSELSDDDETELNVFRRVLYGGLCRTCPTQLDGECVPIVSKEMMDVIDELDENADDAAKEKILLYLTNEADANRDNPNGFGPQRIEYVLEQSLSAAEAQNIVVADAKTEKGQNTPRVVSSPVPIDSLADVEEDNDDSSTDEKVLQSSDTFDEIEQEKMEHQSRFIKTVCSGSWDEFFETSRKSQRLVDDDDDGLYMSSPDRKSTSFETSTEDSVDEMTGLCSSQTTTKSEALEEANITSVVKSNDPSNRFKDLMTELEEVNNAFDKSMKMIHGQLETNDNSKSPTTTTTDIIKNRERWEQSWRQIQKRNESR